MKAPIGLCGITNIMPDFFEWRRKIEEEICRLESAIATRGYFRIFTEIVN
jgi:hypothetical protein